MCASRTVGEPKIKVSSKNWLWETGGSLLCRGSLTKYLSAIEALMK
jgi:hypothetical protein